MDFSPYDPFIQKKRRYSKSPMKNGAANVLRKMETQNVTKDPYRPFVAQWCMVGVLMSGSVSSVCLLVILRLGIQIPADSGTDSL